MEIIKLHTILPHGKGGGFLELSRKVKGETNVNHAVTSVKVGKADSRQRQATPYF